MTAPPALLALACTALWGANASAVQFTQDDLPPLGTAGLRFAISVPFLVLWSWIQGESLKPRRGEWPVLLLVGLLVAGQIGTFHYGSNFTNSAHASLIVGMNPVVVAALAHFFLRGERLNPAMVAGFLVAAAGLVAVVTSKDPLSPDQVTVFGNLVLAGSCLLLGLKLAYSKHVLRSIDPGRLLVWTHAAASALLLGGSGAFEGFGGCRFTAKAVAGLAFMGIVVAVFCFAAWTLLLRRHPASQLQAFGFAQPAFGVAFGMLLRGDPITPWLLLGAAGIGAGIALVTWGGNVRARAQVGPAAP